MREKHSSTLWSQMCFKLIIKRQMNDLLLCYHQLSIIQLTYVCQLDSPQNQNSIRRHVNKKNRDK
jgi:hypothetical protein